MQRILLIPLVMIATNFILKSGTRAKILTIALIIDAIWNLRNQVVLNGDQIDIQSLIKVVELRFLECLESFDPKKDRNHKVIQTWSCPPIGMVKLNVDAATTDELAWLPVVARDDSGNILKLWTKATSLSDPVVVDANAI